MSDAEPCSGDSRLICPDCGHPMAAHNGRNVCRICHRREDRPTSVDPKISTR